MDLGLEGKVAIVNGASQGIGFAIARTLADEGARVAISARREPALGAAYEDIARTAGGELLAIQGDIRRAEDCERIVGEAVAHFGGLDILVNNDGAPPLGFFTELDDDAWRRAVDRNLMSVVRCIRAAVPHMKARGAGSIVNITALSAIQPIAGFGLSVATWAGVIGLAKTLSRELAPEITINTLAPGLIDTPRLRLVAEQSADEMNELIRDIPLGRLGDAEEVAAAVAFLTSPRGRYITGTTLAVDGGLSRATL
ncbi:MAG: glucose 1-dehydrogenase [Alphaproteobacteria bacterium]|nr:glucose 1-dehydrogenase [Alphaproteobacteria bacterium]